MQLILGAQRLVRTREARFRTKRLPFAILFGLFSSGSRPWAEKKVRGPGTDYSACVHLAMEATSAAGMRLSSRSHVQS